HREETGITFAGRRTEAHLARMIGGDRAHLAAGVHHRSEKRLVGLFVARFSDAGEAIFVARVVDDREHAIAERRTEDVLEKLTARRARLRVRRVETALDAREPLARM